MIDINISINIKERGNSAIKMKKILPFATAQTDHKGIMLSLLYLRNSEEWLLNPPLQVCAAIGA